jgi:hypothetical protein
MVSDCLVSTMKVFGIDMSEQTSNLIVSFLLLVYNFSLVAGTAYLVTIHEWSMWTFLLTILFITTQKTKKDIES